MHSSLLPPSPSPLLPSSPLSSPFPLPPSPPLSSSPVPSPSLPPSSSSPPTSPSCALPPPPPPLHPSPPTLSPSPPSPLPLLPFPISPLPSPFPLPLSLVSHCQVSYSHSHHLLAKASTSVLLLHGLLVSFSCFQELRQPGQQSAREEESPPTFLSQPRQAPTPPQSSVRQRREARLPTP